MYGFFYFNMHHYELIDVLKMYSEQLMCLLEEKIIKSSKNHNKNIIIKKVYINRYAKIKSVPKFWKFFDDF